MILEGTIHADDHRNLGRAPARFLQHGSAARRRRACTRRSLVEVASIREIPLYDGDLEAERGIPEPVRALKDRIGSADGLLLVTPEYNNSIPGVFKNAVDWLSRPANDIPRVFGGKPVTMMGATPGMGGTALAHAAWLPVLRTLGTQTWFGPRVYVSNAAKVFGPDGRIVDETVRASVAKHLIGFAQFIARVGNPT